MITGGNYSTECCREPEEWGAYPGIDKMFIADIHRRFGKEPLTTFPIVDVFVYKLYYKYIRGMQIIKPLDLIPYVKKDAEVRLEQLFRLDGNSQHKHHESRFTRFFEDYWPAREKFGFDRRRAHFSSLIMTGQMSRADALERIKSPELDEHFLTKEFAYVASKLELSVTQLREIFEGANKTCADYRNKLWAIDLAGPRHGNARRRPPPLQMIAIVDYGVGNVLAIRNVYGRLNIPVSLARDPAESGRGDEIDSAWRRGI